MINITTYCKKFYKKPYQFLDNQYIKSLLAPEDVKVTRGLKGGTLLDKKHLKEFFLWLSPQTKQMVIDGKSLSEIQQYLNNYRVGDTPKEDIIRHYQYTGHNSR